MLRFVAPVGAAVVVLAAGVGCGTGEPVSAQTPPQRPFSFSVGSGTIVPPTAHGISVVVDGSSGSFRTLRPDSSPRVVLADASADLDGDGLPDLVTHYNGGDYPDSCSEDSGVTVCTSWASVSRALGPGRFRRGRVVYESDVDDLSPLAAGDVTGDGRPDLLLPFSNYYGDNGVRVFANEGAGRFVRRNRFLSTGQPPVAAALVDLDGDGSLDLITANDEDETNRLADGSVSVFLGAKGGGFGRRYDYPVGGGADGLVVRDLNDDGRPDVVVSRGEAGPFVSVLLNRGDGTFAAKRDYRGARRFAEAVAVGDVDGDGRPDLLVANGGHGISVLLNHGSGTFGRRLVVVSRDKVFSLATGDLNGDGRADVLAETAGGSPHAPVLVLLNAG
jgi:VCBS repeat protein